MPPEPDRPRFPHGSRRDGDRQVAPGRRKIRDRPVGRQIEHLRTDPRIPRTEEANVRNSLAKHENSIQADAQCQAAPIPRFHARGRQYMRSRKPTFGDLDQLIVVDHIDLSALTRIGMAGRRPAPGSSRQQRGHNVIDHALEVTRIEAPPAALQTPEVELVRGAGVQSIDDIASMADSRQRDEDVVGARIGGGQAPQCRRYAGRRGRVAPTHR